MEYLDTYDENGKFLGQELRSTVHKNALWHKTVHCWLYDASGNIYFQIRKEEQQLYTTASGHVQAGESVQEAFGREIKEEIGISIDYEKAILVGIYPFRLDRENADGSFFRDRAFSNVYVDEYKGTIQEFKFDPIEVSSLVKCKACEVLSLLQGESQELQAYKIEPQKDQNQEIPWLIREADFLVNKGETLLGKYGDVVKKVIALTQ